MRCSTKCLDSRKGAALPPLDEEKPKMNQRYQEPQNQEFDTSQVEGVWDASKAPPAKKKGRLNLPTIPQVNVPAYQRESPAPDAPSGVEYGRPGIRDVSVGEGYGKVSPAVPGKEKDGEESRVWRKVRPDDGSGEEGAFQDPRRPGRRPPAEDEKAPVVEDRPRERGGPIDEPKKTRIEIRTPQKSKPGNSPTQLEPPKVSEMELAIAVAETKLVAGDYKGALQDAEAAVQKAPGDSTAWLAKAKALDALGLHPEAEAAAQESVRLSPDYAYAHEVLAWVQYHEGKNEEAGRSLARAVELEPGSELARAYQAYAAGRGEAGTAVDARVAASAMASGSVAPPSGISAAPRKAVKDGPRRDARRGSWAASVLGPLLGGVLILAAAGLAVFYFSRKKA
jgi:hypothetical protein